MSLPVVRRLCNNGQRAPTENDMRPPPAIRAVTALLLVVSAALTRSSSPAQSAPAPSPPTLKVYSRETIVDVTVTDAKGNPVYGLNKEDFTVSQDGKPESIRSFKEFGDEAPTPQRTLPNLPPGTYTNDGAVPSTGPVNIILLDVMHTHPASMEIVKRQVVEFLKTMPPATEVAIFILSASPLDHAMCAGHLLQGFTSDAAVAASTVAAYTVLRVDPSFIPDPTCDMTLGVLKQITAYVSGIKGRKNLMWFTTGVPIFLLRDGGYSWMSPPDMTIVAKNRAMYDRMTAAQIAVYPVSVAGLQTPAGSVSSPISSQRAANNALLSQAIGRPSQILLAEAVAADTGGEAIYNTNDFKSAAAKVLRDGSNFYTLTYVPPPFPLDSRYHTIDVKVNRPGLTLTYRKGFNAEDPAEPAPKPALNLMQGSMTGGAPSATQLLFNVHVQPSTQAANPAGPPVMGALNPTLKKSPLTRYGLLYALPIGQVAFTGGPNGTRSGALEFDVAAFDTEGRMVTALSQTLKMPLSAEEYQQVIATPFQFFQQIDLPPGTFTLRAGILDSVSNRVGTVEVPVTVPKPSRSGAASAVEK
jgi:VWFA-related protein